MASCEKTGSQFEVLGSTKFTQGSCVDLFTKKDSRSVPRTAASVCCPESIGWRLTSAFNTRMSSIGDSSPLTSCPVLVGAHGPCADPLPHGNTASCPPRSNGWYQEEDSVSRKFDNRLFALNSREKWPQVRKQGRRSQKRTQANSHMRSILPFSVMWRSGSVLMGARGSCAFSLAKKESPPVPQATAFVCGPSAC